MRIRTIAAAVAVLVLPLTACGSDSEPSGQPKPTGKYAGCDDPDISETEFNKKCLDDAPAKAEKAEEKKQADLHPKVGDSYRWPDGLIVTVARIEQVTTFAEFDTAPEADQIGFRIHVTFDNEGKKPVNLSDISLFVEGGTNGGEAAAGSFETGQKEITGRLAPGVKADKTDDYVIDKKYGRTLVITVQRADDDSFGEDWPEYTGTIR